MGVVSEPTKFERIQPIATMHVEFFFCSVVCVIFVRKSVHFEDHFFSVTQFQHGLSEPRSTNESIVNVQESFLPTLLWELICSMVFFFTFLPVPVTVWPTLPDVKVRDREEIKNGLDVLLVFCCVISPEVPARAVDDASASVR